jgi:hypothetical protein
MKPEISTFTLHRRNTHGINDMHFEKDGTC